MVFASDKVEASGFVLPTRLQVVQTLQGMQPGRKHKPEAQTHAAWSEPIGDTIGNTIGNSIGNSISNTIGNSIGNTIGNTINKIIPV